MRVAAVGLMFLLSIGATAAGAADCEGDACPQASATACSNGEDCQDAGSSGEVIAIRPGITAELLRLGGAPEPL